MENIIEKIHRSALKFLVPLTPEETYKRIVHEAVKLIGGEDGLIHIKEGDELRNVYASSPALEEFQPRHNGFAYKSMQTRKAYVIHPKQFKKIYPKVVAAGVKSVLFIPLFYKEKSYGVMAIRSHANQEFTKKELHVLKLFGTLATLAIRKTQLYSEAQNTIAVREKFIAMAAHELRTPLTTLSGYAQLLHKKLITKNISEAKWSESLLTETHRLENLIEELLEVNRLNAGRLDYHFSECNIATITKSALSKLAITYPQVNINYMNGSKDLTIIGDQKRLSQAIFNILDNSVKFSSYNSKISVKIDANKTYNVVTIQDKGKGIDKDEIPKVLEGFYKASGNEQEGMGTGLYYTKSIVEKHQGELEITSELDKGTQVKIKIPKIKYGRTHTPRN